MVGAGAAGAAVGAGAGAAGLAGGLAGCWAKLGCRPPETRARATARPAKILEESIIRILLKSGFDQSPTHHSNHGWPKHSRTLYPFAGRLSSKFLTFCAFFADRVTLVTC
jgi:hypothetical protein